MSYKYELHPNHRELEEFLLQIPKHFANNDRTIHKARNEIKIVPADTLQVVVKAYKVPNPLNRFIYTFFRKTKPYKAYHYALKLQKLGINTPTPIGYIEFYENALLHKSYFLSEYFPYDFTMAHIRDDQPEYKEGVLKAFALFTRQLHKKGVWHSDYSAGNILVKKENGSYTFSIVDINRMQFFPSIEGYKGLENFNKLWFNEEDLTTIAKEYAKVAHIDEKKAIELILKHDRKLKAKVELKRKLRGK